MVSALESQSDSPGFWLLNEFFLGCLEFKSLTTLVNRQMVASFQLWFLTLLRYLSGVFVN